MLVANAQCFKDSLLVPTALLLGALGGCRARRDQRIEPTPEVPLSGVVQASTFVV